MARFTVWLSAFIFSISAAHAANVTLEDVVTTQRVNQVITTRDGNLTAYTKIRPRNPLQEKDGSSYIELFLINSEGETIQFITGDVRIRHLAFSPDSSMLYYLAKREGDKHTSLYRIPVDGGESERVLEHETAILSYAFNDAGDTIAFRAKEKQKSNSKELSAHGFRANVYEENVAMTKAFLLSLEDNQVTPVAFDEQVHSLSFRPGTNQLLVRAAPSARVDDNLMSSQYVLLNQDGSEVVRMQTEGKLGNAAFSKDGSRLAIVGAEDKHDPARGRLFLASLRDGSVQQLLPNFLGHVQDILWQDNDTLVWLAAVNTETTIVQHNVRTNQQTTLLPTGKVNALSFGNMASDGTITLLANSPAHPNEAFTLRGTELTRLTDSNAWVRNAQQPRSEVITYQARDGLEIEGILVYPLNYREGQQVPVIMAIHGGPESHIRHGWNDRYSTPTWYMAQEGFATFFPNYRGSTGRGVEFSKLSQNDYAGKEFDDIVDAKKHLVAIGFADEDRVGITGGSYGGYASAWGATKETEHFAASVMFVGISNNLSKFGTTDIPNEMNLVHARSYPWDKWMWYLERSPIYWAEQGRTPILIMHGEEDTRVHPSQSMELYRYLKVHGNVPVRLVTYPGEGHGNKRSAAQLDYAYRMERWMKWYLQDQKEGQPPHELEFAISK
ncbi:S9 family peptidase [Aliidiomarina taiwanensis]|uniref:S9 family peptidase n=1 Tax=Aliidiomarina taiwanensis TaxID=946228 RepID=A0A432X7C8_9GAMM|nr:S9 family peptidase [Aliidiomarina taiwanensis]RUO42755.1 S9 family peptidase [Aliidiomarina taiwanensis]